MKLNKNAEIFIPDGAKESEAFKRTTHLIIGAHQDDLEIMAYDAILKCFGSDDRWVSGIVVTNGAGSPRTSIYSDYSDEQMQNVRKKEQKKAAYVGEYGSLALLGYTSSQVRDSKDLSVKKELKALIIETSPQIIYTHNLADKHDTHVAVAMNVLKAIRELPKDKRPEAIYGCEVWRGLDWMLDEEKTSFDVDAHPNLASALVEVYDSQISGGKRYDLATIGRRLANATYAAALSVDEIKSISIAMDLTPLILDDSIIISEYAVGFIQRFQDDVKEKIIRFE